MEDIAHQIGKNISKIETPQTREMLKLVLTALHTIDSKLPSVMKNSFVITKLWAEITARNESKSAMKASL